MCGIAGFADWKNRISEKRYIIENMIDTLSHRGPNESGIYADENIMLGHKRLTVIDPNGGKQPMIKQVGERRYVIVYNGELYNTDTLRNILKGKGHNFESYSDTEVVITSFIEWGADCLKYFNGIFAFAIWNEIDKILFMARDHLGVKPLFYTCRDKKVIFGSEIKALLAYPEVEPIVDQTGLCELFGLGPARTQGSGIFKGIKEIKAGHYVFANEDKLSESQYWDLEYKEHTESFENTLDNVRSIFVASVKRQLVSDVPLCTFLSGGLDSSAISAIAAKEFKESGRGKLHTYSIEYVDNDKYFKSNEFQPEADPKWTAKMVDFIDSEHHIIYVDTKELTDSLTDAVVANDLPGMADVDSSMLLLCREVSKNHTVALSGECADEIFGGYPWFWRDEDIECNTFPWSKAVKERREILSEDLRRLPLEEYVEYRYNQTLNRIPKIASETKKDRRMREIYYLNHKWFMTTLLNRKDRMSMASGLEARVPFSDKMLTEYVWNIPWQMKYYNNREKGLLREALKGILPDDVIQRKKSPFPKTHNPEYTKEVQKRMRSILNENNSPILNLIDRKKLEQITETGGMAFKKPWYGQLMTGPQLLAYLIQINTWLEVYKVQIV